MSFAAKIAVIFISLAICAAGMFIIPRESKTLERPINHGTPVLLHDSSLTRGLRV